MKISSGVKDVGDGKDKTGKDRKEKEKILKTHKSVIIHTRVAKAPVLQSSPNSAQLLIQLAL